METSVRQLPLSEYPRKLLEIPEVPESLWIEGTLPKPTQKVLTVVGSRALSSYGREATTHLLSGLRGHPITIVSGLALGADQHAHEEALRLGLHAVAVPGSGLGERVLSPRSNLPLARRIVASGGALLSEHDSDYVPRPYDFPSRNRIMVGLSDAVLMIEAGERSGTLITARLTAEYNRELLCVPHRIGDIHGVGSHQFIRMGATLVSESAHILEALGLSPRKTTQPERVIDLTPHEEILYEKLREPMEKDSLIRTSGLLPGEALTALLSLELKGYVEEKFSLWRRM